ncbi:MAG: hypothetical protein WBS20_01005 [Lysobacterales bacterium]
MAIRDLNLRATAPRKRTLVCLLLALLLAGSNVAYSAHISSHLKGDSSLCSLCIHPGGPDSAIAQQAGPLFAGSPTITSIQVHPATRFLTVVLCAHQSRAPPRTA